MKLFKQSSDLRNLENKFSVFALADLWMDRCADPPPLPQLYTVVQHVKHFNDVVEFGENQEFTDDFEYLETGLKSSQPLNTRCLR